MPTRRDFLIGAGIAAGAAAIGAVHDANEETKKDEQSKNTCPPQGKTGK